MRKSNLSRLGERFPHRVDQRRDPGAGAASGDFHRLAQLLRPIRRDRDAVLTICAGADLDHHVVVLAGRRSVELQRAQR